MNPLPVLVVDDHPVVRRGLRTMLDSEPWVAEVLDAASVAEALQAAATREDLIVAMDITLPDGDGIEATARLLRLRPGTRVLILTMSDEDDLVARSLRAGARGYVLKDTDPDAVVDALRTVAAGGVVLGPKVGPAVLAAFQRAPVDLPPPFDQLTTRERELLAHLTTGENNARIARHLGLSEKTIRNQVSNVLTKLGVGDRVQAALLARDAGITG
jgi:DNA-binding NarL/FixJ family response regulator